MRKLLIILVTSILPGLSIAANSGICPHGTSVIAALTEVNPELTDEIFGYFIDKPSFDNNDCSYEFSLKDVETQLKYCKKLTPALRTAGFNNPRVVKAGTNDTDHVCDPIIGVSVLDIKFEIPTVKQ